MTQDWQRRLYAAYVSTGQGGINAEQKFASSRAHLLRLIGRHVPANRDARILDLGCGAGNILYFLKLRGFTNLDGVDFSKEQIDLAHRLGLVEARQGDIVEELSRLPDGSVDVIFAMDILEHLDGDTLFRVGDEVFRVLRGGGKLIVHVPNADAIFGSSIRYGDLTHERAFNHLSMRQFMRAVGFTRIACFEDTPVPHGIRSTARAFLWWVGTLGFRLLNAAETGQTKSILSRNFLATAIKPQ